MSEWDDDNQKPVAVNANEIDESRLNEIIKAFIMPDDTDHGLSEQAYQTKERLARKQIASGSLVIVFDQASDTTMLMSSQDWRKFSN